MDKWAFFLPMDFDGNPLMSSLSLSEQCIAMALIMHLDLHNTPYFDDSLVREVAHQKRVKPSQVQKVLEKIAPAFDRDAEGRLYSSKKVKRTKTAERQRRQRSAKDGLQNDSSAAQKTGQESDAVLNEKLSKVEDSERDVTQTVGIGTGIGIGKGIGTGTGSKGWSTGRESNDEKSRDSKESLAASEALVLRTMRHVREEIWSDACDKTGLDLVDLRTLITVVAESDSNMIETQFKDRAATDPGVFTERILGYAKRLIQDADSRGVERGRGSSSSVP